MSKAEELEKNLIEILGSEKELNAKIEKTNIDFSNKIEKIKEDEKKEKEIIEDKFKNKRSRIKIQQNKAVKRDEERLKRLEKDKIAVLGQVSMAYANKEITAEENEKIIKMIQA